MNKEDELLLRKPEAVVFIHVVLEKGVYIWKFKKDKTSADMGIRIWDDPEYDRFLFFRFETWSKEGMKRQEEVIRALSEKGDKLLRDFVGRRIWIKWIKEGVGLYRITFLKFLATEIGVDKKWNLH